jgi:hypothetical protein
MNGYPVERPERGVRNGLRKRIECVTNRSYHTFGTGGAKSFRAVSDEIRPYWHVVLTIFTLATFIRKSS